ncbi:MAG: DUF4442 domain-containing protein [Bacteroidota bacterium]
MENNLRKWNRMVWLMGLFKIPIIGYVKPRITEMNDELVRVKIRLRRRTKNHLKSMYFGALCVGADVAGGIFAFYFAKKYQTEVSFAFKGVEGEFLKRPESDVIFECTEGAVISAIVDESLKTGERINKFVLVNCLNSDQEIVATFNMNISVKAKSSKVK